jgi:hypothetical protein
MLITHLQYVQSDIPTIKPMMLSVWFDNTDATQLVSIENGPSFTGWILAGHRLACPCVVAADAVLIFQGPC